MSKLKIPRKKKKQIPTGFYCYTPTSGFKDLGGGRYGYTIKECIFFKYTKVEDVLSSLKFEQEIVDDILKEEGEEAVKDYISTRIGFCSLLKCSIDDQCKSCGLKYGF